MLAFICLLFFIKHINTLPQTRSSFSEQIIIGRPYTGHADDNESAIRIKSDHNNDEAENQKRIQIIHDHENSETISAWPSAIGDRSLADILASMNHGADNQDSNQVPTQSNEHIIHEPIVEGELVHINELT